MFSLMYIFLVGWFVIRITQQLPRGFPRHMDGGWVSAQNGPHGLVKESSYFLFTFKIGHFSTFSCSQGQCRCCVQVAGTYELEQIDGDANK